jgi:hypothetical protein
VRLKKLEGGQRLLRSLFAVPIIVLAIYAGCWGQYYSEADTVSVIPASGFPGDTVNVSFYLVNSFDVGGFEIRLAYDNWSFHPLNMRLSERSNDFNLFGADFTLSGVASLFATSWSPLNTPIIPGRGAIASVDFVILDGAQPGLFSFALVDSDSLSHQNSLSSCSGDSLVVPILISADIEVLSLSGVGDNKPVPARFELSQNYPNPFNGGTRISFNLGQADNIDLTIYDLSGRAVITLYSGSAPAGENTIYWDGKAAGQSVSSGLYLYKLKGTLSGALSKTMTLLK